MAGQGEERRMPNFLFFDGHGDEVGGMLFHNLEFGEGFRATRHLYLSLDGYKQDQTVRHFHRQTPDGASSGLVVNDRPEDRSRRETFQALGFESVCRRCRARGAETAPSGLGAGSAKALPRARGGDNLEPLGLLVVEGAVAREGRRRLWPPPWSRLWPRCRARGAETRVVRALAD